MLFSLDGEDELKRIKGLRVLRIEEESEYITSREIRKGGT